MKATIEIPDELYRRVKAKTALEGRPVRALTVELFRRYVDGELDATPGAAPMESERPVVVDGKPAPAWFGQARKYARRVKAQGMDAVRESIARGWAQDVAEREVGMRQKAK